MGEPASASGPDFAPGVPFDSLVPGVPSLGHVGGDAVVAVRVGDEVFVTGANCTHYGGALAEGRVVDGTIRCPLHHACFDLRSGEALGGPALSPLACYDVVREGGLVRVGAKRAPVARTPAPSGVPASVVIVGAGPAGTACAVTLRAEGFKGPITMVGAERPGPVDRPNLSKDYLAGTAPEEWIALRDEAALREINVELVADDEAVAFESAKGAVTLKSGRVVRGGSVVLATGATPIRLPIDGASKPHVHTLRTLGDAKAVIAQAASAKHAVVIGASFIGLEAAASLRARGIAVTVVAPEALPLAKILGDAVGTFVRGVHEAHGTVFRLGTTPVRIDDTSVALCDGTSVPADLVVMGVGVRPNTKLATDAGLRVEQGIVVDARMRTSASKVYAVGDVARSMVDGSSVRIEHFAVAIRHGQAAARAIVGRDRPGVGVPFFWSQHHDVTLAYVGHAPKFDTPEVRGDLAARDATVIYRHDGRVMAVLTVGRDRTSLAVEAAMERGDNAAVERAVAE